MLTKGEECSKIVKSPDEGDKTEKRSSKKFLKKFKKSLDKSKRL